MKSLSETQKKMLFCSITFGASILMMIISLFRAPFMDSSQALLFWGGALLGVIGIIVSPFSWRTDSYKGSSLYNWFNRAGATFIINAIICTVLSIVMFPDCSQDVEEKYSVSTKPWSKGK